MVLAAVGMPVGFLLAVLGARVLRSARRSAGRGPDALAGGFFLCVGVGGGPALLAGQPEVFPTAVAPAAMALGHLLVSVGFACLYAFAWRCFGADSAWRRGLALAGIAALAVLWISQGAVEGFEAPGGAVVRVSALVRMVAVAWAFGETARYRSLMRRRLALGLGDPLVANRFLLWSLWTGAMLGSIGIAIAVRFLLPEFGPQVPLAQRAAIVSVFLALVATAAGALWLSFFPPRWYAARLRGAHGF